MKIFKDSELKEEVEKDTLSLGTLKAGETETFKFYIYNESEVKAKDIKIKLSHEELKILKFPKELDSEKIGILEIQWEALVSIRKGLEAPFEISWTELFTP